MDLSDRELLVDPTRHHQVFGSLVYLTISRTNIAFPPITTINLFFSAPTVVHWSVVVHILFHGTVSSGLVPPSIFPAVLSLSFFILSCFLEKQAVNGIH